MSKNIVEISGFDIEPIWDKPGNLWSDEEYDYACNWVFETQRYKLILFTLHYLGAGAELQNAEDALHNFFVKQFNSVVKNYNPRKGMSFLNYTETCLKHFCYRERVKIFKESDHVTLEDVIGQGFDNDTLNPEKLLFDKEAEEALSMCLDNLTPIYRDVFLLWNEGYTEEDTAKRLGISLENVKIRRMRAREKLLVCLRRKGWPICK